jgi:hypothetical protein
MHSFVATSPFPELDLFCFFSLSQTGWAMLIVTWQLLSISIHSCQRITRVLPVFVRELRRCELGLRLTLRTEFVKNLFYPLLSLQFLILRDGKHILDFFKTLPFSNTSPPLSEKA